MLVPFKFKFKKITILLKPNSRFNKRILNENRWKQRIPKNNLINRENKQKQNVGEKILGNYF